MATFPNGSRPNQAIRQLAQKTIDEIFNRVPAPSPHRARCKLLFLPLLAVLKNRWQSEYRAQDERLDESLSIAHISLTISYLLLYAEQTLNLAQLSKLMGGLRCPTLIVRTTVCIHQPELSDRRSETPNMYLAQNPLAVH